MNQYSLSKTSRQQIFETLRDLTARETARLSRECSKLALQNIAGSNFDLAHFYFELAKEFMLIAVRRKEEMPEAEPGGARQRKRLANSKVPKVKAFQKTPFDFA